MKTKFFIAAVLLLSGAAAFAQNESNFKFYGFIRNYAHVDTKESLAGTVDLFNYVPKAYHYNSPLTTGRNWSVGLSINIDRFFEK